MSNPTYQITHTPANHGRGGYAESWCLDARSIGRGLTTHPTRAQAQERADSLFPRTALTVQVWTDGRVSTSATYHGGLTESIAHLRRIIADIETEIASVGGCPVHAATLAQPEARGPAGHEKRPFAYCCAEGGGDPAKCDCVNKNHGTAWFPVRKPEARAVGEAERWTRVAGLCGELWGVAGAAREQHPNTAYIAEKCEAISSTLLRLATRTPTAEGS